MNAKEWAKVSWPIAAVLPGFQPIRRGFVRWHDWLAECIYAESSSTADHFYIEAFVLPLFVPTAYLYFSYGFRIGNTGWDAVSGDLVAAIKEALPRLEALASPAALVELASNITLNVRHAELRLCAGLIMDDGHLFESSRKAIEQWVASIAWEDEVIARSRALLAIVDAGGMDAGLAELRGRCAEVARLLR
jgi:hypothetical protein